MHANARGRTVGRDTFLPMDVNDAVLFIPRSYCAHIDFHTSSALREASNATPALRLVKVHVYCIILMLILVVGLV